MKTDWTKKEDYRLRAVAKYYQKSGYDWQLVEKKIRQNWLPEYAEFIIHCYYNN